MTPVSLLQCRGPSPSPRENDDSADVELLSGRLDIVPLLAMPTSSLWPLPLRRGVVPVRLESLDER